MLYDEVHNPLQPSNLLARQNTRTTVSHTHAPTHSSKRNLIKLAIRGNGDRIRVHLGELDTRLADGLELEYVSAALSVRRDKVQMISGGIDVGRVLWRAEPDHCALDILIAELGLARSHIRERLAGILLPGRRADTQRERPVQAITHEMVGDGGGEPRGQLGRKVGKVGDGSSHADVRLKLCDGRKGRLCALWVGQLDDTRRGAPVRDPVDDDHLALQTRECAEAQVSVRQHRAELRAVRRDADGQCGNHAVLVQLIRGCGGAVPVVPVAVAVVVPVVTVVAPGDGRGGDGAKSSSDGDEPGEPHCS